MNSFEKDFSRVFRRTIIDGSLGVGGSGMVSIIVSSLCKSWKGLEVVMVDWRPVLLVGPGLMTKRKLSCLFQGWKTRRFFYWPQEGIGESNCHTWMYLRVLKAVEAKLE
ncbi:hypothetical protein CEXT_104611 [Caerostris extrusa]|uniref:Uncharacterized protein n=1 Tax=Caerostris extrusa TaxID=172846 RepID=A0AAV4QUP3_CAEEX|nr:hypothetical protein CEXT_104611 [Caerostris extrusa]